MGYAKIQIPAFIKNCLPVQMPQIEKSMNTRYIIFSHHPKDMRIGVCTTIYNVFLGPKPVYPGADYIFTGLSGKAFKEEFTKKVDADCTLLFNGCYSLLNDNAIYALEQAQQRRLQVIIYWHETAWNLNNFSINLPRLWKKLTYLLHEKNVKHWVPFSQGKHLIMYIFKKAYEDVLIVHEAIDLEEYRPAVDIKKLGEINISMGGGAGLARKGVDYFIDIAKRLQQIDGKPCRYTCFGITRDEVADGGIDLPDNVEFPGFVSDFPERLRNQDIFLMTSRDDPSPIVAFGALACDMPVFCFENVGTREVVPEEFVAFDTEDMVHKIQYFWGNRAQYPPGFFRDIAARYSPQKFLIRIHKETGSPRFGHIPFKFKKDKTKLTIRIKYAIKRALPDILIELMKR